VCLKITMNVVLICSCNNEILKYNEKSYIRFVGIGIAVRS
jgi:hypothetical protein